MNRTIKFRGKNLYNNEWIFSDLIQYESGEMAIFSNKRFFVKFGGTSSIVNK
ncbi:hypothetical protein [Bacteroides ovatus]|uniref:hypothetical protein n=1 Tax=Bacteroides ovatus TaxID=28116 RepID=UPI0022E2478D|nr:hypothetical protein [Bacteroides ovatus]